MMNVLISIPSKLIAISVCLIGLGCSDEKQVNNQLESISQLTQLALESLDQEQVFPFADLSQQAQVLIFVRTDCPIANRYAPEIKRLQSQFKDVANFCLIYPEVRETSADIKQHLVEFGYSLPAYRDPKHHAVRFTEVNTTPEVVVYLADGTLVYRGRIDNRFVDYGKARAHSTEQDLEQVLLAISKDQSIRFFETDAVGCPIPKLATASRSNLQK